MARSDCRYRLHRLSRCRLLQRLRAEHNPLTTRQAQQSLQGCYSVYPSLVGVPAVLFPIMHQCQHGWYHRRKTHMTTLGTCATPTFGKRPIQSSTRRTINAVVLPIQKLGGIASGTKG